MKKIISLLLILLLALSSAVSLCATPIFASDAEDGYTLIKSEADFLNMTPDGKYQLANDIDLTKSYQKEFCGTFDGNGKKINIGNNTSEPIFSSLKGATIKNLRTIGHVKATDPSSNAGGIANIGSARFENVTNQISVTAEGGNYSSFAKSIGGFIGHVNGASSFVNCTNTGAITISTTNLSTPSGAFITEGVGGIVGSVIVPEGQVIFEGCSSSNFISSLQSGVNVGGLIGYVKNTDLVISNCENTADILGKAYYDSVNNVTHHHTGAGGIIGTLDSDGSANAKLVASNTKNTGSVTGTEVITMVGGFIGMSRRVSDLTFIGCSNTGYISNNKNVWEGVGGILGFLSDNDNLKVSFTACSNSGGVRGYLTAGILAFLRLSPKATVTFNNCYNTGYIESTKQYNGGIAGFLESEESNLYISKCVNTGTIKAIPEGWGTGGILGSGEYLSSATIENCVNTGESISGNSVFHAAGIASSFYGSSNISIKGCVNAGNVTHTYASGNVMQIAYANNAVTAPVYVNNTYFQNASGNGANATSATLAGIKSSVDSVLTTGIVADDYVSVEKFNEARIKLSNADSASSMGSAAIELLMEIGSLVAIEEYLSEIKSELIANLGEKLDNSNSEYTAQSYEEYCTAFDSIIASINNASSAEELDSIKIDSLRAEAESKLTVASQESETQIQDSTEASTESSTETETILATETTPQTDSAPDGRGCGAAITSISIIALTTLAFGACLVKKED